MSEKLAEVAGYEYRKVSTYVLQGLYEDDVFVMWENDWQPREKAEQAIDAWLGFRKDKEYLNADILDKVRHAFLKSNTPEELATAICDAIEGK